MKLFPVPRRWPLFIAVRYIHSKRRRGGVTPAGLSIGGIAVGVSALIAVLGVMNGFQLGFIESILSIHSFHLRVYGTPSTGADERLLQNMRNIEGIETVLPFRETQSLIRGGFGDYRSCVIRGIPDDAAMLDPDMMERLNVIRGDADLRGGSGIMLGSELARRLAVDVGETVEIVAMSGTSFTSLRPSSVEFHVRAIFRSGYYEFDSSFGFIEIGGLEAIASKGTERVIGVKLSNRYRIDGALERLRSLVPKEYKIVDWREYNRAFFGALRVEKLAMMLLIGLIFIVVAVNIKNSLERSVMERRDEIAVLRSLGAAGRTIRNIFLFEGVVIGLAGALIGSIGGLLISGHINEIFSFAERVVNGVLLTIEFLLAPITGSYGGRFSLFSPAYFYIQEVPSRVLFPEFFFIFLFAVVSSTLAAYAASKRSSEIYVVEILRDE